MGMDSKRHVGRHDTTIIGEALIDIFSSWHVNPVIDSIPTSFFCMDCRSVFLLMESGGSVIVNHLGDTSSAPHLFLFSPRTHIVPVEKAITAAQTTVVASIGGRKQYRYSIVNCWPGQGLVVHKDASVKVCRARHQHGAACIICGNSVQTRESMIYGVRCYPLVGVQPGVAC